MRQQRHAISQTDHTLTTQPHSHVCVATPAQEKWASPFLSVSVFLSPSRPWSFSLKLLKDDLAHAQICCRFFFFSLLSSHLFGNVHRHVLLPAYGIPECHTSVFRVGFIYTQLLFIATTPEPALPSHTNVNVGVQLSNCFYSWCFYIGDEFCHIILRGDYVQMNLNKQRFHFGFDKYRKLIYTVQQIYL